MGAELRHRMKRWNWYFGTLAAVLAVIVLLQCTGWGS